MHVLGRIDETGSDLPTAHVGSYRARDGSAGAQVGLDLDRPHAGVIVGKRGYGKSYTLGVLAEAAARATGVAPVVFDPMGALAGLADDTTDVSCAGTIPATSIGEPTVAADAIPPATWPRLVGLDSTSPAGALVWRAAAGANTLAEMRTNCADRSTSAGRTAENHLNLAASWDVFDPGGLSPGDLTGGKATVIDLSGMDPAAANAIVRGVARGLYESRLAGDVDRLPWLFLDEAHAFFDDVAGPALRTVLTRGRAPGISLLAATQRPSALPDVAISQADLLIAHRLTSATDLEALGAARPTYLDGTLRERLPTDRGDALIVDDTTESAHVIQVRERMTPHTGASPRASDC